MIDVTLSQAVFKRDGFRCRHCHFIGNLHPHHIIHASQGGQDAANNLITLCAECHRAHHDGFLKIDILVVLSYDVTVKFTRLRGWKPK